MITATPPATAVGCDVVSVARVAALVGRRPAARAQLFTPAEQRDAVRDGVDVDSDVAMRRLAARFAAKEALVKLLQRPRLAWTDVEVVSGPTGAPALRVRGVEVGVAVTLSHDGDVAMACVAAADDDLAALCAVLPY